MTDSAEAERTLSGIRVLDLSRILAGPFCTMMLGDQGAEILKVARPGVGADPRTWGPPFAGGSAPTTYAATATSARSPWT